MTISEFIYRTNLQVGDAVVLKKTWGFLDHYAIYLGEGYEGPTFVANMMGKGVKILSQEELNRILPKFKISRIRPLGNNPTPYERRLAVRRAEALIGRQGYHLLTANCEHAANYIQTGEAFSRQSKVAVNTGLAIGGLALLGLLIREVAREEEEEDYI